MKNVKSLYLYPTHDTDLCGLLEEVGEKDFRSIAKDSLKMLTRPGYVPKISIPKFKPLPEREHEKVVMVRISIQSEKDEDIRELISHIKPRQFNTFVKTAMRFYIGVIPTLSCLLDMELIKTVPVYTPNGVIVFPNAMNMNGMNFSTRKKSTRQKKETIKKANDMILNTIKSTENSPSNDTSELKFSEESVTSVKDIESTVDNSTVSTNNYISENKNLIPDNTDFNDTGINDAEVDVLSLLENLLD